MEKWWKVSKHSSKHVLFRGGAFFGDAVQCGSFLFVAGWPVAQERGRTFGLSLCFLVEGAKIISIPPNRFYQLWTQGVIEDDLRTSPWIGWGTNVCRLGWNDPSYPLCWGLLRVPFKANYSWISKAKKWPLACSHPATCSGIALLQGISLNARGLWNNLLQPGARCRFPTKQLAQWWRCELCTSHCAPKGVPQTHAFLHWSVSKNT